MSDAWATLLTAVVPGALVLAGVVWTLRHQRRLASEAREEERVNAQRRLLAGVIWAAREKDRAFEVAMSGRPSREPDSTTDARTRYRDLTDQFERLLTEALLFVGDTQVVNILDRVQNASPLYYFGPGAADPESVTMDASKRAEFHEALTDLQRVVAAKFRCTVPDSEIA